MSIDFKTTFVVEAAPEEVWEALTERTVEAAEGDSATHYVLAGFPSFEPLPVPGASCTALEVEPERLLRVRKDHQPCQGTEIAIQLEQAETGTRITLVQSGFGDFLKIVGRDVVFGHGYQIARDLQLYLERRVIAPPSSFGRSLGLTPGQLPYGVEVHQVSPEGFAATHGIQRGDLLLSVAGIRLHDIQQLNTVTSLIQPGADTEVTWVRGRELMSVTASF